MGGRCLYEFPRDTITNYHKPGGSKQPTFILKARSLKSRCVCRAVCSLKALDENLFLALSGFQWLLIILSTAPQLGNVSTPIYASIFTWSSLLVSLCPLLVRTSIIGLQHTLLQYDLILTRLYLQRCYCQIRSQ